MYLIGAGPGDPELLTLRAARRLGRCDVVLYDGLSNPTILDHAPDARHINVGKHGQSRIWTQREIIAEMLDHARAGRIIGRLKGGDPAVFARTAEEVDACVAEGIEFEIVPGVTAALAAGSFAGIPVTHRDVASAVALVTGHETPDKPDSALDWDALARFPGTLVVYMGVTTAAAWTSALIGGGKDPATPCALVRRCTMPDQQQIHCRLDQVATHLTPASKFRPPVITIVGEVTRLADTMHWLRHRPLFGQTVMVTRPTSRRSGPSDPTRRGGGWDADPLGDTLRELGASVINAPMIRIEPLSDYGELDETLNDLGSFDAVFFSSRHGVDHFLDRFVELGGDLRRWSHMSIGCVGDKTRDRLATRGLIADWVPETFSAADFAEQFGARLADRKVVCVRASRGDDSFVDALQNAGASVHRCVAYRHIDVEQFEPNTAASIDQGRVDWITVTSSATAENLKRLLGEQFGAIPLASLAPGISKRIGELGGRVVAQAERATMESLVESIVRVRT